MNVQANMPEVEATPSERDPFLAFVVDEQTESLLRDITDALLLPPETVRRGTLEDAHNYLAEVRSPSLLIVDVEGLAKPVDEIVRLGEVCELGTRLIVIGSDNDVTIFRDLLSIGAADYLVKPLTKDQVMGSISALEESGTGLSAMGRTGKIVSFIGARGGAGTSTLVANCSWLVANESNRRVAMVDLDTHFGNLALMLGAESRGGLADALMQPDRIDSLFMERVTAQVSDRLYVMGGEESFKDPLGNKREAIDALLTTLKTQFHYVVMDLPRMASELVARALQLSGTVIVVSDLSLAGMRDTQRILKYIREINPGTQVGLVVNKVGEHQKAEVPVSEFEKGVNKKIDFQIPFEANAVMRSANLGESVFSSRSNTSKVIRQITEKYIGIGQEAPKKGFLASLKG